MIGQGFIDCRRILQNKNKHANNKKRSLSMNPRLHLRSRCAISVLALLTMLSFSACDPASRSVDVARSAATSHGEILGVASPYDPDITVYRGVPYAAPPVDELRWQPPQPPIPSPLFCNSLLNCPPPPPSPSSLLRA